ncbi:MAG: glycosyltransferase, partial [Acidobacteriota bacterium]|nr:glycosyltransferase [Acidobacteriota bacterium]
DSPLAARLLPIGWARPLLSPARDRLRFFRDVRELRRTIDRELFDVVHCHSSHDHYAAAAARRSGVPLVVRTIHNLEHARGDLLSRRLFRRTDAFVFANRAIAEAFGADGPIQTPVVDAARFSPREKPLSRLRALGVPDGAFVVGTVGKLAAGRGHREAIESAAALLSVILLHVGKGELRPELESRAAALGAASRNVWAGYAENDLPELYRAMDVFLFPASGSEQGQRALLEAMASGVPVVAVDVPGVRDLVTHEREGLVVSEPADLVPALERMRNDDVLRKQMGERGRARALLFGAAPFASAAREFYARLLERKSSTSRAWDAGETAG